MNKTYTYNAARYILGVMIPTFMSVILFFYFLWKYFIVSNSHFYLFITIVSFVVFIDHFFGLTHPKIIINSKDEIIFCSFGKKHHYVWKDIKRINVRKNPFTNKIYLRIGETHFLKGRYWINVNLFNNGTELLEDLTQHEARIHPMMRNFNKRSTVRTNHDT